MSRRVCIALVHHPVLDRAGETVTTAITNLDLHDMSRSARTYGATPMYVVHPVTAQRTLAERIKEHWVHGSGRRRIPDRGLALETVEIVPSLDDVVRAVGGTAGRGGCEVWSTAASARDGDITTYAAARARLDRPGLPVIVLFGTGWGLAHALVRDADVRLEPIRGGAGSDYNHLSVRAACAISLDRLLGAPTPEAGTGEAPGT